MPGKNKINKCKNAFENVFIIIPKVDGLKADGPESEPSSSLAQVHPLP